MLKADFGNIVNVYFNPLKGSTMYSLIHMFLDYNLLSLILMYCLEIYRNIEIVILMYNCDVLLSVRLSLLICNLKEIN